MTTGLKAVTRQILMEMVEAEYHWARLEEVFASVEQDRPKREINFEEFGKEFIRRNVNVKRIQEARWEHGT
jgi:hypothetical protein